MRIKQSRVWRFFSSIKLAIWLLSLIAIFSSLGTFIPQNEEASVYIDAYGRAGYAALSKIGLNHLYSSWWFILFLILFSLNLSVCLLNRLSLRRLSLGSNISHLGVLVILLGALLGITFGQKGSIKIAKGQEVSSFRNQRAEEIDLGYIIRLDDFIYTENIDPKEKILVYPPQGPGSCALQGSPHMAKAAGGNEPIAKISPEVGAEAEIADTGYRVKVLRYLPDFVMDTVTKQAASRSNLANNPAVELELKDKSGKAQNLWVFSRFPDMHQTSSAQFSFVYNWARRMPKDFVSKVTILKGQEKIMSRDIRVNDPFSFGGYTFFQSSYDSNNFSWSGLQVVKDPGVAVVYAGFLMLIIGLVIIFYVNPLWLRS